MLFPMYLCIFFNTHKNKIKYNIKHRPEPDNSHIPLLIDYDKENLKYGYKPFFKPMDKYQCMMRKHSLMKD